MKEKVLVNLIDFSNPIPIFREIDFECEKNPFGLPKAQKSNLLKSPCCESIEFIPHAHTTHLETPRHINADSPLNDLPLNLNRPLFTIIVSENVELDVDPDERVELVIIKKDDPIITGFKGVAPEMIKRIIDNFPNVEIIGTNEQSFDPEDDGGAMLAHKIAFEKVYLVEVLDLDSIQSSQNAFYYCFLNLFRFGKTDAYPCCPMLYPVTKMALCDSCLFCKIIRGVIPSFKVFENSLTLAFLDINPLSEGHIVSSIISISFIKPLVVGHSKVPWWEITRNY